MSGTLEGDREHSDNDWRPGIAFGTEQDQQLPGHRDFAYVAFTRIRRTVPAHATLSSVFGVVIVAGTVILISGLFR